MTFSTEVLVPGTMTFEVLVPGTMTFRRGCGAGTVYSTPKMYGYNGWPPTWTSTVTAA